MSKSYRKEVLKRLQQELNESTDTKEIIRIGNAIAKLTKPKRPVGRPPQRKPVQAAPSKPSVLDRITDTAVDSLSTKERLLNHLVVEYEKRCRAQSKTFSDLSRAEKDAVYTEVMATLSDEDRAALDWGTHEAA